MHVCVSTYTYVYFFKILSTVFIRLLMKCLALQIKVVLIFKNMALEQSQAWRLCIKGKQHTTHEKGKKQQYNRRDGQVSFVKKPSANTFINTKGNHKRSNVQIRFE